MANVRVLFSCFSAFWGKKLIATIKFILKHQLDPSQIYNKSVAENNFVLQTSTACICDYLISEKNIRRIHIGKEYSTTHSNFSIRCISKFSGKHTVTGVEAADTVNVNCAKHVRNKTIGKAED